MKPRSRHHSPQEGTAHIACLHLFVYVDVCVFINTIQQKNEINEIKDKVHKTLYYSHYQNEQIK